MSVTVYSSEDESKSRMQIILPVLKLSVSVIRCLHGFSRLAVTADLQECLPEVISVFSYKTKQHLIKMLNIIGEIKLFGQVTSCNF